LAVTFFTVGVRFVASTGDPDATITATLDGSPWDLAQSITANGHHTLQVFATDPAGNQATSVSTFTIQHLRPLPPHHRLPV
jgi:hypothetical protein